MSCPGCGDSFEELDPRLFSFNSPHGWCEECRGFGEVWKVCVNPRLEAALEIEMEQERQHDGSTKARRGPCPVCHGARLNAIARNVRVQGRTIDEVSRGSGDRRARLGAETEVHRARKKSSPRTSCRRSSSGCISWARSGSDYLALDRSAKTLSGGESQRIRLAAQLGSNLRGVLYVLDEPTIGLHPRDNEALLDTLEALKAKGNSLVIVEHDEDTMRRADTIIDLGPGAGSRGGEVVAHGHARGNRARGSTRRRAAVCASRCSIRRAARGVRWKT